MGPFLHHSVNYLGLHVSEYVIIHDSKNNKLENKTKREK